MSDEAGFLKAIAEQPAERSTRFVYADWLDEHKRPREAEFLRLQLQVAELSAKLLALGGELDVKWLAAVGDVRIDPDWFTLRSGRKLLLREFRQRDVYEGLMAGIPSSERNRESVAQLVASERHRRNEEPYLIAPVERPAKLPADYLTDEPRGWLPTIACVGRFLSSDPAQDQSQHASELVVIWFQHEFAFPIDPGAREQIRAIEWEKHAHDFKW